MNYNLMPVKYFIDVVQTHGFISAAKRNYVSETAVSSAIKKLEVELGQKLINRSVGELKLTPVGEEFYRRAVEIINLYSEIWHHPNFDPKQLLRIHFLPGFENEAVVFAAKLPQNYQFSFDEEDFETGIRRLINGNYDLLVGFELAFAGNRKVECLPLRTISFDLLLNRDELEEYNGNARALAQKSTIYMQNWQSTGIMNIQRAILEIYNGDGWGYQQIDQINSFSAACLNVNYNGGLAMVPESFVLPAKCMNIYRCSPAHLQGAFTVVLALNAGVSDQLKKVLKWATT